jgi:hypothetical protein
MILPRFLYGLTHTLGELNRLGQKVSVIINEDKHSVYALTIKCGLALLF